MEESFFGFDTEATDDLVDNAGEHGEIEFDRMNDETFGEGAVQDGDWEEQHEKLAGNLAGGADLFGLKTHENELEHRISRMVVEEEEEESKHGVAIHRKQQMSRLDELYGPSSPPGYLRADGLVAGHQNIWGSPVTQDNAMKQQENDLKSLLRQLQQPTKPFQDPSIVLSSRALSSSLPSARTVSDVEQALQPTTDHPAAAFTFEQLEANLQPRPDTSRPPPQMPDMSQPPPPMPQHMPLVDELEAVMHDDGSHNKQSKATTLPLPIGTPPQNKGAGMMLQQGTPPQQRISPTNTNNDFTPQHSIPVHISQRRHSLNDLLSPPSRPRAYSVTAVSGTPSSSHRHAVSVSVPATPEATLIRAKMDPELIKAKVTPSVALQFLQTFIDPSTTFGAESSTREFSTPPKQRVAGAPVPPFNEPAHVVRSPQQQPPQPGPVRQNTPFPNRGRGGPPRPFIEGFDNGHHAYRDNRNFNNWDNSNFHDHRDGYHNNHHVDYHNSRGDYRNNRGDFHNNRGDFHNNRGDFPCNRGDFPSNRGDFPNNRGDFPNNRGDFHNNRGDFHSNRGDFHSNRGGYRDDHRDYRDDYRGGDYYRGAKRGGYRSRHDSFGYDYDEDEDDNPNRDPYAGLMTKKEKDWIIKIQMMQLQTENPYLDDYYYTAWQLKKIAEEQRKKRGLESQGSTDNDPKLLLPQLAGRLEICAYRPVQFENSLGRLTAASVHNPRQIIDVSVERPADKDERARELRRYKELLLHIEMSYDILLDIEDIERRAVVLPEEARPPLLLERQNSIKNLYHRVLHEKSQAKHFSKIISVRKGVKLVARILPLLQVNDATDILSQLLHHLSSLAKKDWQKEVLPGLYSAMTSIISMANLETLVRFADAIRQGSERDDPTLTVVSALQHPLGSSVIWCLVNRGEHVYVTCDPLDMDVEHQHAWKNFVAVVAEALSAMSKDQVAQPKGSYKQVTCHFERLIDKRALISIEDKLQQMQYLRAA